MFNKYSILITLVLLLVGCQKEDLINTESNQPIAVVEKTVENGRFVFSSKESLKATIEELQSENNEKVEQEFENFYKKGFR